jgi:porphobilinogen synthase
MSFKRFRTLRTDEKTRDFHAEVHLNSNDFVYPYFVIEGNNQRQPISSLHGVSRFSIDELLIDLEDTISLGINKILLFGVIDESLKDETGTAANNPGNLISRVVRIVKSRFPSLIVITDVCLCGYTSHGHCGLISNNEIDNDSTLPLLAKMALTHAEAGADFVAPSAMMDGQVESIRELLNSSGFVNTKIMAYSAKYASAFYGPFRDAAHSAPSFGDRKSYQMDYRTIEQSVAEVEADISEGADWMMVKPAHTYLDIIHRVKSNFPKAILAAYQVSGEYMMIKAAASAGYMDERTAMTEALTAIKRAGADYIISYYAKEISKI